MTSREHIRQLMATKRIRPLPLPDPIPAPLPAHSQLVIPSLLPEETPQFLADELKSDQADAWWWMNHPQHLCIRRRGMWTKPWSKKVVVSPIPGVPTVLAYNHIIQLWTDEKLYNPAIKGVRPPLVALFTVDGKELTAWDSKGATLMIGGRDWDVYLLGGNRFDRLCLKTRMMMGVSDLPHAIGKNAEGICTEKKEIFIADLEPLGTIAIQQYQLTTRAWAMMHSFKPEIPFHLGSLLWSNETLYTLVPVDTNTSRLVFLFGKYTFHPVMAIRNDATLYRGSVDDMPIFNQCDGTWRFMISSHAWMHLAAAPQHDDFRPW